MPSLRRANDFEGGACMRRWRVALSIAPLLSVAVAAQPVPPGEWLLYRHSAAIMEATIASVEMVARPERMGRRMAQGLLRAADPGEYLIGYLYVLRVEEVVKGDGLIAPGDEILTHTSGGLHEFMASVGERRLLFLNYVWGTEDETKLRGAKRIRSNPRPVSYDPADLPTINLAQVYRVSHQRAVTMRDYEAYKELLRAQGKPVVWMAQPAAAATLQGVVTLRAEGYDDSAITSVQFHLDGAPIGPQVTDTWLRTTWRSKDVANGPHLLTVLARDSTGEETLSEPIPVTTQNTNTAPALSAWPPTGSGFTSAFTWNWSDPDGDALTCVFTVVEHTQCSSAGHCAEAGGAAAGATPCQARVEYGQPLFTRCTYRLACSDGWATTTAEFRLN